jgi:hypothetical protein
MATKSPTTARRPEKAVRGEAHMSMRVAGKDKRAFTSICKKRAVPQSEMFRRFVAAVGAAGMKTKVVTIRITGYSPI